MTARFDGTLRDWDGERGFGFIEPRLGGQPVFVHISAFKSRRTRPSEGQVLTFEVEMHEGKKRAKRVELMKAKSSRPARAVVSRSPIPSKGVPLLAIPAFVALYGVVHVMWAPPGLVALLYLWTSLATFVVYAVDKSMAKSGDWRIAESKLHLGALIGGWPGALLAQRLLRHKSSKQQFQDTFKVTVFLNVLGFLLLCSPMAQKIWPH